jgi:hypothetical protein
MFCRLAADYPLGVYAERMSTAVSPRVRIADNVNAELARKRYNTRSLPKLLGKSYSYWQRRTSGDLPFDVDELLSIAAVLDVSLETFFAGVEPVVVGPVTAAYPRVGTKSFTPTPVCEWELYADDAASVAA